MIHAWANKWGVPPEAVRELQSILGREAPVLPPPEKEGGKSEAYSQSKVRLAAARDGVTLWRNNVGALKTKEGRLVRFGLANDSAQANDIIKSGDLIGIRPVLITLDHVGTLLGQFVSREAKAPGWRPVPSDERLPAQQAWVNYINARGGDACITDGTDVYL